MLGDASEAGKSEDDFIPELETVYSKVTPPLPSVHLFADRSVYLQIGLFADAGRRVRGGQIGGGADPRPGDRLFEGHAPTFWPDIGVYLFAYRFI